MIDVAESQRQRPGAPTTLSRGLTRAFKREIAADEELIKRFTASSRGAALLDAVLRKTNTVGRQRALSALPAVLRWPSLMHKHVIVWPYLSANTAVIQTPRDAGETQECVTIRYLLASAEPGKKITFDTGLWTLEVPDHAMRRFYQRAQAATLRVALREAHDFVLRLHMAPAFAQRLIYVATGTGAFVCEMIGGFTEHGDALLYMRARTWLRHDQLGSNQVSVIGEPSLGAGPFLPSPLRTLTHEGNQIFSVVPKITKARILCWRKQN